MEQGEEGGAVDDEGEVVHGGVGGHDVEEDDGAGGVAGEGRAGEGAVGRRVRVRLGAAPDAVDGRAGRGVREGEDAHCAKNRMSGLWSAEQPLWRHLEARGAHTVLK